MLIKEKRQPSEHLDISVIDSKSISNKRKNFFEICDEQGNVLSSGFNILLNTGRRINALKILGQPQNFTANENTSGTVVSLLPSSSITLKLSGFGVRGGDLIVGGSLPLPSVVLPSALPLNDNTNLLFSETEVADIFGTEYSLNKKIKRYATIDNPIEKIDDEGFIYHENTLVIAKDELTDKYFNEIVIYVEFEQSGSIYYIPYSMFNFAPLHNQNGDFQITIKYGIYI